MITAQNVCFAIAGFIFFIASVGAWKWPGDFEPVSLGLFFMALGLLVGPVIAWVATKRSD